MASTPYTNKDFSDSRLKTNFAAISTPIAKVQALQGLTYNGLIPAGSDIEIDTTTPQVGLIAQAVQGVLPQAVIRADFDEEYNIDGTTYSISGDNYLTVDYGRVVPLLVEAIKAQQVLIAAGIGTQGIQGVQGLTGIQGSQGLQGAQGTQGIQGLQGVQGAQGTQGLQGIQGIQGIQGTQGTQGLQGITGLAFTIAKTYVSVAALTADTSPTNIVAGQFALINTSDVQNSENSRLYIWDGAAYIFVDDLSGTAGIQGITGAQGTQGIQGIQGVQGITGSQGTIGTSVTGAQGIQGITGAAGAQGTQGAQGIQGLQGITGAQGTVGTTGAQGTLGTQGITGAQGITGTTGAQGTVGTQGTIGTSVTGAQGTQGISGASILGNTQSWTAVNSHTYLSSSGIANSSFNVGSSILGGVHINPGGGSPGASYEGAITFGVGSNTVSQAGIYVSNNSSEGTHMAFATTDSYATGPQIGLRIMNTGYSYFPRSYVEAAGSFRAPVFYDSNDTAYYTDPASTSRLNVLRVGAIVETFAALNVSKTIGGAATYRDIDIKGSWSAGEGHSITASHGTAEVNMVGQMVFQHDSPGSRIKWGRLYHSGDQSTYPMHLISEGSSAYLEINAGSMRAPLFYDSNDTAFYLNPNSVGPSAALASSIYLGTQSADGVLWDYASGGAYRPGMQVRGQYPHIDIVSVVSNGNHGGTLRFMGYNNGSSGAYKHWVIGTAASDLTFLDFGFASDASNPHQGISGYEGVTLIRATTSGNVGIGGDWGTYGTNGNPSYPLHVIGIGLASASLRAPIFYDSDDTSYFLDPNSGSTFSSLKLNAGWGGSPYGLAQFTIRSNYPSIAHRNTESGGYWLVHHAVDNTMNWYGGTTGGVDAANWARNMYLDMSGNLTCAGNVTAYSDAKLKKNVKTIDNALNKVMSLRGVNFDWISTGKASIGLIAQEVEKILPEVVLNTEECEVGTAIIIDTIKSVDYSKIVSVLIEAIKEQQSQIEELKLLVQSIAHK